MAKITIQTDTIINTEAELYEDLQKALNGLHNPEDDKTLPDQYLQRLIEESGIYLKAAFDAMLDEIEECMRTSRKSAFEKSERRNPDLVQKEVQVTRDNKTFTRKQWVRPEENQEQRKTLSKQELSDFIRAYDRAKKENTSAAMEMLKENGIHWEESKDPTKNWENANAVMIRAKNMIIEKRGLTPEVYSVLGLDFPGENGTISVRDVNIKPLPITDEAIQNVPNIHSSLLTDEQNIKLQKAHQELLKFVKDEPLGREAMAVYDMEVNKIFCVKGKGFGSVEGESPREPQILIHNHPSGETFTYNDLEIFSTNPHILIFTAISNKDGEIYVLEKQENYNVSGYGHFIENVFNNNPDWKNTPERYIKIMNEILRGGENYGIKYYTKRR